MTDRLTPKIIGVFQEGYSRSKLKSDVLAGLTVAIVAMPLSMAIAIASGVTPDKGLFTAIVGGFLVSLEHRGIHLVQLVEAHEIC